MEVAQRNETFQALAAAALFGASAPIAKLLLGQVDPIFLAGFLYLGSGAGILLFRLLLRTRSTDSEAEAKLSRLDVPWLIGAVVAGGFVAPIVLMFSLRETAASTASLLLNFEGVATALIAAVVFKEAISGRALWAVGAVTLGSVLLSWNTESAWGFSLGALGIVAACFLWGIDNNLTRNISAKDPLTIVLVKGLGAGSVSFVLALLLGHRMPPITTILGAMLLGSLSYGLSIVLFIRAMRGLGAARTSAVFGTAPLAGVVLSFVLFQDAPTLLFGGALVLMIFAMALLITERHAHLHRHEAVPHDHRHRHDDGHHHHDHPGMTSRSLTHSHVHTHEALEHEHPHLPDIHHRHAHHEA
ncbi:MAG: DMT family transporter [Chloroflexi bacterium]|uniref:DMT family transporter n=1 Tax=Candidatus Flexifilum breve TaxID=3140694 RepID=UPI0031374EFD|nr:DMT family transporter [Chloroflexota bacterium]